MLCLLYTAHVHDFGNLSLMTLFIRSCVKEYCILCNAFPYSPDPWPSRGIPLSLICVLIIRLQPATILRYRWQGGLNVSKITCGWGKGWTVTVLVCPTPQHLSLPDFSTALMGRLMHTVRIPSQIQPLASTFLLHSIHGESSLACAGIATPAPDHARQLDKCPS